jgi:hypothetical protein
MAATLEEGQIVLEEEIDEDYEPTEEEVLEYAEFLGIDVETQSEFLWIARQGLKTPLSKGWKPCQTPEGDLYYFNFENGESSWDHPCDSFYKKLLETELAKARGGGGAAESAEPAQAIPSTAQTPPAQAPMKPRAAPKAAMGAPKKLGKPPLAPVAKGKVGSSL